MKSGVSSKHWGSKSPLGNMLKQEYEAFQIEVGLYGDILMHSWKDMGELATKNIWFENLWQLCSHYGIKVHMAKDLTLGPVQERDVSIIAAFWDLGFRGTEL